MNHALRVVAAIALLGLASGTGQGLTADAILARVEEGSFFGIGRGNLYVALAVMVEEVGQPTIEYAFRVWAKDFPDGTTKTLLLYTAPELVAGTLYLAHIPETGTGRMWLWLPALEIRKEIVSDSEREGEFIAGSGISYDDIATGFGYREGYTSTVRGEEVLLNHKTWRLELVPANAGLEWSRILLWVHQGAFIVLRAEFFDQNGILSRVLTVPELVEDALGLRPTRLVVESLPGGSRATVKIVARSSEEIPDAYFLPENLGKLNL